MQNKKNIDINIFVKNKMWKYFIQHMKEILILLKLIMKILNKSEKNIIFII